MRAGVLVTPAIIEDRRRGRGDGGNAGNLAALLMDRLRRW